MLIYQRRVLAYRYRMHAGVRENRSCIVALYRNYNRSLLGAALGPVWLACCHMMLAGCAYHSPVLSMHNLSFLKDGEIIIGQDSLDARDIRNPSGFEIVRRGTEHEVVPFRLPWRGYFIEHAVDKSILVSRRSGTDTIVKLLSYPNMATECDMRVELVIRAAAFNDADRIRMLAESYEIFEYDTDNGLMSLIGQCGDQHVHLGGTAYSFSDLERKIWIVKDGNLYDSSLHGRHPMMSNSETFIVYCDTRGQYHCASMLHGKKPDPRSLPRHARPLCWLPNGEMLLYSKPAPRLQDRFNLTYYFADRDSLRQEVKCLNVLSGDEISAGYIPHSQIRLWVLGDRTELERKR